MCGEYVLYHKDTLFLQFSPYGEAGREYMLYVMERCCVDLRLFPRGLSSAANGEALQQWVDRRRAHFPLEDG